MNNQIITVIKNKLEEVSAPDGPIGAEIKRNSAKEILQYYVLNFIYHHPKYSPNRSWFLLEPNQP